VVELRVWVLWPVPGGYLGPESVNATPPLVTIFLRGYREFVGDDCVDSGDELLDVDERVVVYGYVGPGRHALLK